MTIEVAITFDDLPVSGASEIIPSRIIRQILNTLAKHHITAVYGFMNGNTFQVSPYNSRDISEYHQSYTHILHEWVSQGHLLGNHTFSHMDLNKVSAGEYIDDIRDNEVLLKKFMRDKNYKYFRYPYLHEGETQEKRDKIRQFLIAHQYQFAHVTTMPEEYRWNQTYIHLLAKRDQKALELLKNNTVKHCVDMLYFSRSVGTKIFQRDIKYILLLHAQVFTAFILDDILTAYKNHNVKFISLPDALSDEAYQENPNIVNSESLCFLQQLCYARELEYSGYTLPQSTSLIETPAN